MKIKVRVKQDNEAVPAIFLDKASDGGATRDIVYGTKKITATVKIAPGKNHADQILVIQVLSEQLMLRNGQRSILRNTDPGQIVLGPLIGINISAAYKAFILNNNTEGDYGRFIKAARSMGGEVFLFAVEDVDKNGLFINGVTMTIGAASKWKYHNTRFRTSFTVSIIMTTIRHIISRY